MKLTTQRVLTTHHTNHMITDISHVMVNHMTMILKMTKMRMFMIHHIPL